MQNIALFGGTFDPVHQGHIQTCLKIQAQFKFDAFFFMPCKIPVLKKTTSANSEQRIKMLELALAPHNVFSIDRREMQRDTPSYMVLSLESYKQQFPQATLTIILGYDAFSHIDAWYQWGKILQLCNIIIIKRDHQSTKKLTEPLQKLIESNQISQPDALFGNKNGALLFFNAGEYNVSSTQIRSTLKSNEAIDDSLIPREVLEYINQQELYR